MKYTGELSKPMRDLDELIDESGCRKNHLNIDFPCISNIIKERSREEWRKMLLLLDHFDIDEDVGDWFTWYLLALKLAQIHVPGLRSSKKAGAKQKWLPFDRALLKIQTIKYIESNSINNKTVTITHALTVLSKNKPWSDFVVKSKNKVQALRRQYSNADDRYVKILEKADLYDEISRLRAGKN